MATELVSIDVSIGLEKVITSEGVKNTQHFSVDEALARVAHYLDEGYEIISSGGGSYVMKKKEGPGRFRHEPTF
jgi:hypothetical protein